MNIFVHVNKFKAILSLKWIEAVCSAAPGDEALTLFLERAPHVRFI